jgi:tripartite-type tricarboxylate transporter receptor subunit TctC
MNFWKKAVTLAGALVAGIGCLNTATCADEYPSRTIAMVVSFPPGGLSDVAARIIADGMSRVGTARVAMATPDGMGSHVATPALTPNLRYDSTKEFEPIGLISNAPVAVVALKDFPAKDLNEFIASVKEHGDGVKQADAGAEIRVALNPWPEFPRFRRDGPHALTGCRHE